MTKKGGEIHELNQEKIRLQAELKKLSEESDSKKIKTINERISAIDYRVGNLEYIYFGKK